jgi:hypothetical protein
MNTENEVKPPTMAPPSVKQEDIAPVVKQEKTSINTHKECSKGNCMVGNRVTNCPISELPPIPDNQIKQENKSERKRPLAESPAESSAESPVKIFRVSEHIGKCPSRMVIMLFDVKNKKPFMVTLNIASSSYHIFKMMEWSKDKNIEFDFITEDIHLVMYTYSFFETGYTHSPTICNETICDEAMKECEKQKMVPFEDEKTADEKNQNEELKEKMDEYPCLKQMISKTLVIDNTKTKGMRLNVLMFHFIEKIIDKMKERKETIELVGVGHITDMRDQNMFEEMLFSVMEGLF